MAFSVHEFRDLVQLLEERPEWRAELRRLVLTEELLQLPAVVRELAAAQERTAAEVADLRGVVGELAQAQQRTEGEVARLARAQEQMAAALATLATTVIRLDNQVGRLRGDVLEVRYRSHAGAYFGRLVARARVVADQDLVTLVDDARDAGVLGDGERDDLLLADLVVRGRRRADGQDVYLVVEVSAGIGPGDVRRAADRAAFLRKVHPAEAVVAGEHITPVATDLAGARGVWVVVNGRTSDPSDE